MLGWSRARRLCTLTGGFQRDGREQMAPGRAPIVGRVAIGRNAVKRVIFYLFYDPQGVVDDYVPYKLQAAASLRRPHLRRLQLDARPPRAARSSRASPTPSGCARTPASTSGATRRRWSLRAGPARGVRRAHPDELHVLRADLPVRRDRSTGWTRRDVDFWGVTAHKAGRPRTRSRGRPACSRAHIQSHWIAVRKPMFTSIECPQYWQNMPMITSYDAVDPPARVAVHEALRGARLPLHRRVRPRPLPDRSTRCSRAPP